MVTYNLDADEVVIMQDEKVTDQYNNIVTLVLTNKHLLHVEYDVRGNVKRSYRFPIIDLKESNGNPNILIGKNAGGKSRLELYFNSSQEYYSFKGLMKDKKWASEIGKAYKARVKAIAKSNRESLNTASIFAPVRNKIDSAMNIVLGSQREQKTNSYKCPFYGAVVQGHDGEEIVCGFCESSFILNKALRGRN